MYKEFRLLDFNTWPTNEELNFNESQYEAYKMALTHEFAVIQGPPGTGKTYVGVKIAKTLLNMSIKSETSCLLLVVCYTNHALDQFLEALLPITKSIVRIGGQSRNETLEEYNLSVLRKQKSARPSPVFYDQKNKVRSGIIQLKIINNLIDALDTVILSSSNSIKSFIPDINIIEEYYANYSPNRQHAISNWLFENIASNFNENLLDFYENIGEDVNCSSFDLQCDGIRNVILDNFDISNDDFQNYLDFSFSFCLKSAKLETNKCIQIFHNEKKGTPKNIMMDKIFFLRSRITVFTVSNILIKNIMKIN